MIIGFSSHQRSGKDSAGKMLTDLAQKDGIEFTNKKFAGYLKTITAMLTGIPEALLEDDDMKRSFLPAEWDDVNLIRLVGNVIDAKMTVREFMQKIGTDAIRNNLHPNTWVNALMKDYVPKLYSEPVPNDNDWNMRIVHHSSNWIITDVRFPNEFDAIRARGGILIRINRGGPPQDIHMSEIALDLVKNWDYIIDNNGTLEELQTKLKHIWDEIRDNMTITSDKISQLTR
jgi:hypothetical protein